MSIWRDNELQFLIDNGATLPDADIGMMLGRTEGAVNTMRLRLGIFKGYPEKRYIMTDAEDAFLMQNHTSMTVEELARSLGRSRNTITNWLRRNRVHAKRNVKRYNLIDKETGEVVGRELRMVEAAKVMGIHPNSAQYVKIAPNHRKWKMEEVKGTGG